MGATETSPSTERSVGVPWRSPVLVAILAATLMAPMDVPLISAVLPEIQSVFGVTESRAGLFITLYALPGILLAPVIGALADRLGRRYVLSVALAIFGIAGTAIAFTDDFAVALGLRVFQGFAAGSILAALAMTAVGDRYSGQQHDSVMGVTSAMLSLGTAAYPVIGGYLAARAWNAPFLMYAFTLPVAGLVLLAFDDIERAPDSKGSGYIREALNLIPTRRAITLYGIMFVSFTLLFGGLYTALPFYLADAFGFTPSTVGLVTSTVLLATAVVSTQNGTLAARASTTILLTIGFALYALGFLGVALASTPLLLIAGLLVFGVGSGLVTPTLFARISVLAPDEVRGGVMSLQTTTIGISQAVGPAVFTLLGGAIGYQGTLLSGSVGAALAAVLLSILTSRS
ncbi:MFS transporter [Halobellus limi]|uniref:MFS transporter n=1 Tax=Halobellus limi TaxID=699433 RepID=A0A1H6BRZ8_9EURY|nr:MFS transporter [Halobellus limi]QCC49347.1 MFS transporter [Halobellus limi]SEG63479.1 Predicted arabinose efflux permease, MFS family [Halobellus limi]